MAELSIGIAIDQTEFEKGLANVGRSIGKMSKELNSGTNPFQATANKLGSGAGIGGLLAGPMGALLGSFFDAFGSMISSLMSKLKELMDYANQLRRIAISTGLSMSQVKSMEALSQSFGVSLNTMANGMVEFNKRMGEARIKGGEIPNLLAKMGVGLDEVAKGTFNANQAMLMLAEAYAAGTDEATLLYYGTKLFGDSFKEMLPIIKAGSKAIKEASDDYIKADEEAMGALARLGVDWDNYVRSFKNGILDLVGAFFWMIERIHFKLNNVFSPGFWNPFESVEGKTKRWYENAPKYMTDNEIRSMVKQEFTDPEEQKRAMKELDKLFSGGRGKILSPFGLSEAGAASQMQQMGGGDIFGAVAFSPLERIANATEETAKNTRPGIVPEERKPDTVLR
jgi:hypothetical protein